MRFKSMLINLLLVGAFSLPCRLSAQAKISEPEVSFAERNLGGVALGAGIGAFVGAAVGLVLSPDDNDTWNPLSASLYGGVIGGIIGAVSSSSGNSDRMLDLERANTADRILALRNLLEELQKE